MNKRIGCSILFAVVLFSIQPKIGSASVQSKVNRFPQSTVEQFYNWRTQAEFTGLPDVKDLDRANRFLSPKLICLLTRARDYRNRFIKAYPDQKPPFIEGDLFSSLFEGANRYKVSSTPRRKEGVPKGKGVMALVPVQLFHDQGKSVDAKGWRDIVLLGKYNGEWRITDIQYGGGFEFGNSHSLLRNLMSELSVDNDKLNWQGLKQLNVCGN